MVDDRTQEIFLVDLDWNNKKGWKKERKNKEVKIKDKRVRRRLVEE